MELLDDDSTEVRIRAIAALGKLGEPRALDHLFEAYLHGDHRLRKHVVRALDDLGDEGAVLARLRSYRHRERQLRTGSIGKGDTIR